jgi:hypothetical protein
MTKEVTTNKLPTLSELYDDTGIIQKQNKLNLILNAEPKKEWVKELNGVKYLPIERHEYLLTMIFSKWRVEVKEVKLVANSIVTIVKVWFLDPLSNEWDWQDGIGAMPIQTAKGAGALEFDKMNTKAIQMGAPASESFAIKDACEKLGRIFGKDLNRKDNISYDRLYQMINTVETINNPSISKEIRDSVSKAMTLADLEDIYNEHRGIGKEFDDLVSAQKKFIESVTKDEHAEA